MKSQDFRWIPRSKHARTKLPGTFLGTSPSKNFPQLCLAHQLHTNRKSTPNPIAPSIGHPRNSTALRLLLKPPSMLNLTLFLPKRLYASRRFTRQERIDEAKYTSQLNLEKIDETYRIFMGNVLKVVDLGSAPGTWLRYARNRLAHMHGVRHEELYKKCTVIGVDLLFCRPPKGTFFSQGNIYSQNTHTQVENLLKESPLKISRTNREDNSELLSPDLELSYILKEIREMQLEASIESDMENEGSGKNSKYFYQADLVLSDLGPPPLQEVGFCINTISQPFIRSNQNVMLRQPWNNPEKSSIDMAEAALLLCGTALAKGGTFVVRLYMVDLSDPELLLLEERLSHVFSRVSRWSDNGGVSSEVPRRQNLFMICEDKRDHTIDKYKVFGVKRDSHM